jgi:hypothetical protein
MKDLSSHILDIVQNSIRAKASLVKIEIKELSDENQLKIIISDNGKGMTEEQLHRATDPFYTSRTTRKVGLGLSLLKQNAEMTDGTFQLESQPEKGTKVTAQFGLNHFDRPVMGDITSTLLILLCTGGDTDYVFHYQTPSGEFDLDTREVKNILGNVPLNFPDVRVFLKDMIQENLEQIQISE